MTRYTLDPETHKLVEIPEREGPPPPSVFPAIFGDLPAYRSVASGKMVEGRSDRREDLARTGSREVDPSEWTPNPKTEQQAASERAQLAARAAEKPALSKGEMRRLLKP